MKKEIVFIPENTDEESELVDYLISKGLKPDYEKGNIYGTTLKPTDNGPVVGTMAWLVPRRGSEPNQSVYLCTPENPQLAHHINNFMFVKGKKSSDGE